MYETVAIINNHRIYRMKNTHGCYHVQIKERVEATFNTLKAAKAYAETLN